LASELPRNDIPAEVIRSCEEVDFLSPKDEIDYLSLANIYFKDNEIQKSVAAYELARCLNPSLPKKLFEEITYIDWSKVREASLREFGKESGVEIVFFGERKPDRVSRNIAMFVDDYQQYKFADSLLKERTIQPFENFCLHISDATIIGFRSILTGNRALVNDERILGREQQLAFLEYLVEGKTQELVMLRKIVGNGNGYDGNNGQYVMLRPQVKEVEIKEPIVFLGSREPSNYGSWLFRFLPKLITMETLQQQGFRNLKVLVCAHHEWQRELLKLAGIDADRIINHDYENRVYQCDSVFVPSLRNRAIFLDKQTVSFYQRLRECHGIRYEPKRRIYVSRLIQGKKNYRLFVNEMELIDELRKRDFMIFEPEKYSLLEQMRVFAGAKIIVGPSGSGMFNCVFAPPGTTIVDIEAFPYWLESHACLFASLGHRYGMLIGEADQSDQAPVHKRWTLDINKAIKRIDGIIENL
jgi:capsular polysaccharide biosynthesis protein